MLECIVEGTNIFNPIEGKLDKVIEYFVKFYGEKYRQRIEERLKSTTFFNSQELPTTAPSPIMVFPRRNAP